MYYCTVLYRCTVFCTVGSSWPGLYRPEASCIIPVSLYCIAVLCYTVVIPMLYRCDTDGIPMSYRCDIDVILMVYRCDTDVISLRCCDVILMWYRCDNDVITMWCWCYIDVIPVRHRYDIVSLRRCDTDDMMWYRCDINVILLLYCCYTDVISMWYRCYIDVIPMWYRCDIDVILMLYRCYTDVINVGSMSDRCLVRRCETLNPPPPTTSLSPVGWSYRYICLYVYA